MATAPVTTTVTELPESRVRVEAEVPAAEVEKRVAQAARGLARSMRVPGFRAGKAPPPVVIKRVGREAVLDEAVRESIGGWYTAAIDAAKVVPVGEPDLDLSALPGEGEPLRFSIEIGVRPPAKLGDYKGLEVPRRDAEASDEAIGEEIERLRERSAKLETVDRPAAARRLRGDGLRRQRRRHAVRRRRGPRPDGRARLGPARARLRGAARGRRRRRGAHRQGRPSPRTTRPPSWPARRPSSPSRSRRSRPRTSPSSTTSSPRRPASTRSTSCATTSARASPRPSPPGSRPSSARPRSTPPSPTRRSRCPTRSSRPARASCGTRCCTRSRTRGSPRRPTCRSPAARRRRSSRPARRTPPRRCAARPCWPRSSRPRGSSRPRRSCSRPSARPPRADSPKKLLERLKSAGRLDALKEDLAQRSALDLVTESAKPVAGRGRGLVLRPRRSYRFWPRPAVARVGDPVEGFEREEAKRSEDCEPTRTDGRRADLPWGARVRHLLPAAQRADHLPRHAGRRPDREPDRRPAAAPRVRGSRQGHLALHQLARRVGVRGPRDLRHDAVHQARRADDLRRHRDVDGRAAARRRREGQADGAAEREDPDPPGLLRLPGSGDGHRDPRPRGDRAAPPARRDHRRALRARTSRRSAPTPSATTS